MNGLDFEQFNGQYIYVHDKLDFSLPYAWLRSSFLSWLLLRLIVVCIPQRHVQNVFYIQRSAGFFGICGVITANVLGTIVCTSVAMEVKLMFSSFEYVNTFEVKLLFAELSKNFLIIFIATGENTLALNSPPLPPTAASQSARQHIRNKMTSHLMRQHEKGMILSLISLFKNSINISLMYVCI